jgi:hypothetical protein
MPSGVTERIQPLTFELPDMLESGESLGVHCLADHVLVVGRFAEGCHGTGVAQVPGHLRGGGGLIDRHRYAAGKPDGEIHQGPLVPGPGHNPHAVAGGHAAGHQALGEGADVGEEIRCGNVLPGSGGVQSRKQ